MITGVIVKGIGGFYYVNTELGIVECRARGKMRKAKITPMVGDNVNITIAVENPPSGAVEEIFPRKNSLIRPPVANIDAVVIVIATTSPSPDYFVIDKLIAMAENEKIEIVIAVNKTDLSSADEVINTYLPSGHPVIQVCALNGSGIDDLKKLIKGKTTAFAGNSGVGKSSILNYFGFNLPTGEVSKIERGKHTTRHVELMPFEEGGFVMDTPGFSLLELKNINANELKNLFYEFKEFNDSCKFQGCNHFKTKASGCAVVKAVKDGIIPVTRYNSYCELYDKLKDIKEWENRSD